MKRVIASVLAFVLLLASAKPALALSNLNSHTENTVESVFHDSSGKEYVLKSQDLNNGDARFILLLDDEIIEESYLHRSANTVITNIGSETYIRVFDEKPLSEISKSQNIRSGSYEYMGRIQYSYGSGGLCGYYVYMLSEYEGSYSYDICGTYRSLSQFVAGLATIFGWPGAVSSQVAQWVVYVLDINGLLSSINIPSFLINASATTNQWKIHNLDNFNSYTVLYGTQYIASNPSHGTGVYYGGTCDFFTYSDYVNHNTSLATQFYNAMFSFYPWQVVLWT